jgi:hypothetical protein
MAIRSEKENSSDARINLPLPSPELLFGNDKHAADILTRILFLRSRPKHWVDFSMWLRRIREKSFAGRYITLLEPGFV